MQIPTTSGGRNQVSELTTVKKKAIMDSWVGRTMEVGERPVAIGSW